jgi:hypothetical protein
LISVVETMRMLDRTYGDEIMKLNATLLADAEGTVGCLVLDSGVPPSVDIRDMHARSQVQTWPAGFDGELHRDAATDRLTTRRARFLGGA